MKNNFKNAMLLLLAASSLSTQAGINKGVGKTILPNNTYGYQSAHLTAAPCNPATAQVEMDINNIRTTLNSNGDLWWNLTNAKYEVPKQDPPNPATATHSIFAGALWIGGIDDAGQLKIAGQTYRQTGNDFWSGPLTGPGFTANDEICSKFDKIYKVSKSEILQFQAEFAGGIPTISDAVLNNYPNVRDWPGRNNPYLPEVTTSASNVELAPFIDKDGTTGTYNPANGDYPVLGDNGVIPDQMLFFVANDRGNIHTETGSEAIGLQLRTIAFAFSTNDDVNNMTFYKYTIDYFGSAALQNTYFGVWVDADLGNYDDDFVGCDTARDLGIIYNGDANDDVNGSGGTRGYGLELASLGVDFFKGPLNEDSVELGVSGFVYYNNDFTTKGNPENANHFYGYLSGFWKNGSHITCGGDGFGGTTNCNFMYPDPPNLAGGWSECAVGNSPADRRFLHVSGPFKLLNGAVNEVITGVVWVRPVDFCGSFEKIGLASDKAQALFDGDFQLKDGPMQPRLAIRELNEELSLALYNPSTSNNANEDYAEADPLITLPGVDTIFRFEGYKVYQILNNRVSNTDLGDASKARLIFQCDVKNNITNIINYTDVEDLGIVPVPVVTDAPNKGISHTFTVKSDAFSGRGLVNQQAYYFYPLAYAYNNFAPFKPSAPNLNVQQATPYIESRISTIGGLENFTGIPHLSNAENNGMVLNSEVGEGPQIKRIEGTGNNGNFLEFTKESIDSALQFGQCYNPVYKGGNGPVTIKVYDPTKIPAHKFRLIVEDIVPATATIEFTTKWKLINLTTGEIVNSDRSIALSNEQGCPSMNPDSTNWGFTVDLRQTYEPGKVQVQNEGNGVVGSEIIFEDAQKQWLTGMKDVGVEGYQNWIRSGDNDAATVGAFNDWDAFPGRDPKKFYENFVDGTWAPYTMASVASGGIEPVGTTAPYQLAYGPAYSPSNATPPSLTLSDLASVDIVLTSDKSLWTQCVVIEMGEEAVLNIGGAKKFQMRKSQSIDKDGNVDANEKGRSWFPGYAVNLETGERLNMVFSENSFYSGDNGTDMIWNPTARLGQFFGNLPFLNPVLGGMHYIYVSKTKYDNGVAMHAAMNVAVPPLVTIYRDMMWVSMAHLTGLNPLNSLADGLIPTKTTIKLRVDRPYARYATSATPSNNPTYEFDLTPYAATKNNQATAASAMDDICVVPNPYYAYSSYETNVLENTVYLTNLPNKCEITIFNASGSIVRKYNKDDQSDGTSGGAVKNLSLNTLKWDLQNNRGVPIASGMYYIHINSEGLGERTLKFFAIMKPTDPTSY
jgi:hypothetical protein